MKLIYTLIILMFANCPVSEAQDPVKEKLFASQHTSLRTMDAFLIVGAKHGESVTDLCDTLTELSMKARGLEFYSQELENNYRNTLPSKLNTSLIKLARGVLKMEDACRAGSSLAAESMRKKMHDLGASAETLFVELNKAQSKVEAADRAEFDRKKKAESESKQECLNDLARIREILEGRPGVVSSTHSAIKKAAFQQEGEKNIGSGKQNLSNQSAE